MKRIKYSAPHAGKKDLLLRGLMKCNCYGCQITGNIKKNKYVYYSCTHGKGICKKEWVREEELLSPMLDRKKTKTANFEFLIFELEMKEKKAIITLREPFDRLVAVSDHSMCWRRWDSNPRYVYGVHTLSKRAP